MRTSLYFHEVEHNGDLDEYINDIREAGGKVLSKEINYEAETAVVDIEFEQGFAEKFRQTRACEFSNLAN